MTFFASIPKYKTLTGLEKVKVKNNTLDVIQEERQAFGLVDRMAAVAVAPPQ